MTPTNLRIRYGRNGLLLNRNIKGSEVKMSWKNFLAKACGKKIRAAKLKLNQGQWKMVSTSRGFEVSLDKLIGDMVKECKRKETLCVWVRKGVPRSTLNTEPEPQPEPLQSTATTMTMAAASVPVPSTDWSSPEYPVHESVQQEHEQEQVLPVSLPAVPGSSRCVERAKSIVVEKLDIPMSPPQWLATSPPYEMGMGMGRMVAGVYSPYYDHYNDNEANEAPQQDFYALMNIARLQLRVLRGQGGKLWDDLSRSFPSLCQWLELALLNQTVYQGLNE